MEAATATQEDRFLSSHEVLMNQLREAGLPPLLTPRATAETIGVTVLTLADWRLDQKPDSLPFVRVTNQKVMYRREDVQAFIEARTVVPGKTKRSRRGSK